MTRLCLYVIYNDNNIVYPYVGLMLSELRKAGDIIVVCNQNKISAGREYIEPYAKQLFLRENKGFDAGAIKDTLCDYVGWDALLRYDELLICNDSFYGPLTSFDDVFREMDGRQDEMDYWGLVRSPGGSYWGGFPSHIQSYFIVYRRRVKDSEFFKKFWTDFEYPISMQDAIESYELKLNILLEEKGFTGKAYSELVGVLCEYNKNPYLYMPFELFEKGVPILKRKALEFDNPRFANALKLFSFLEKNGMYSGSLIVESSTWLCKIEAFCHNHKRVYIYGAGRCGRNIGLYLNVRNISFGGYVISGHSEDAEVKCLDDMDMESEISFIMAIRDSGEARKAENLVRERKSDVDILKVFL